ncbi:hypothetical protein EJB05_25812, partial [Eragrostis curvula]
MPPITKPNCPSKCGDVDIHFPFGIRDDCALPKFKLTCNSSSSSPPRLYRGNLEVMSITVETGEMRIVSPVSYICYNSSNTIEFDQLAGWNISVSRSFLISKRRNMFTAIGCSTLAFLQGSEVLTGCISSCDSLEDAARDKDECAGLGCCQTAIPGNLSRVVVDWKYRTGDSNPAWNSHAVTPSWPRKTGTYQFYREDLMREGNKSFITSPNGTNLPLVLDWAIKGDRPCYVGNGTSATYACASNNSTCVNATQGNGYLCNCSQGFPGNPYLAGGCIKDELKMITKQYSKPIGGGNFGKVFMGITKDNQQVAVKRSIVQDSRKTQEGGEFVDEITFQLEMRHKNLVRACWVLP